MKVRKEEFSQIKMLRIVSKYPGTIFYDTKNDTPLMMVNKDGDIESSDKTLCWIYKNKITPFYFSNCETKFKIAPLKMRTEVLKTCLK